VHSNIFLIFFKALETAIVLLVIFYPYVIFVRIQIFIIFAFLYCNYDKYLLYLVYKQRKHNKQKDNNNMQNARQPKQAKKKEVFFVMFRAHRQYSERFMNLPKGYKHLQLWQWGLEKAEKEVAKARLATHIKAI
jgi:Ca2+/Na+ antiporter